jgi:uncharacterized membrane-anchored protein
LRLGRQHAALVPWTTKRKAARLEPLAAKVPEITAIFWVIKIVTTGMGEAMSDALGQQSVPLAAFVGIFGVWLAFRLQFAQREYKAPYYWFAVMMVAVFGTMIADGIRDGAGLTYTVTTPLFAATTALIFYLWWRKEGTLSIHSIVTRRRERFYWLAVLSTFALGTAAGDLTAYTLGWGFFPSAALFGGLILVPAALWRFKLVNPILGFWAAYVLTRPLGASFADGFSKPNTGLNLGDPLVAVVAFAIFVVLVAYVSIRKHDVQAALAHLPHPHLHQEHAELGGGIELQPAEG